MMQKPNKSAKAAKATKTKSTPPPVAPASAAPSKRKAAVKPRPQRTPAPKRSAPAQKKQNGLKLLTISQLAMEYDLDRATVRARLAKAKAQPIIDNVRERRFEVTEEVDALLRGLQSEEMEAVKLRKLLAEAELKESQVLEKRGEMLSTDDVKAVLISIFSTLQTKIVDEVPRKLAPKLKRGGTVPEISALLKQFLEEPFNLLRADYKTFLHE